MSKSKKSIKNSKVNKYTIFIICKNEEIFKERCEMFKPYIKKICDIIWIPAVFLKSTICNPPLTKKLNTRYNTSKKSILYKLGCISAHRNALLNIINNQSVNNLIIEEDAVLDIKLPDPPKESCYVGGWIIPPQTSNAGKIKVRVSIKNNSLNDINYDKFKILTTHGLFIKNVQMAKDILYDTIDKDSIKNYDIYLANNQVLSQFYYPPLFVQGKHMSEIDQRVNKNDLNTKNYGL